MGSLFFSCLYTKSMTVFFLLVTGCYCTDESGMLVRKRCVWLHNLLYCWNSASSQDWSIMLFLFFLEVMLVPEIDLQIMEIREAVEDAADSQTLKEIQSQVCRVLVPWNCFVMVEQLVKNGWYLENYLAKWYLIYANFCVEPFHGLNFCLVVWEKLDVYSLNLSVTSTEICRPAYFMKPILK